MRLIVAFTLILRRGRAADGFTARPLAEHDLVVGSAADAGWRLEGAAPRHCQFGFRGGRWLVVDLGGGTSVNGRPLDGPVAIGVGDVVAAGACELLVDAARPAAAPADGIAAAVDSLLAGARLTRAQVGGDDAALLAAAGDLLRRLVEGLAAQVAERARAQAELGADGTMLAVGRRNPLEALPADRALPALLSPATGGMPASEAVTLAFDGLASHAAATLAGMQGALAAALERFSPAAVRARAGGGGGGGLLSRVMPGAHEAELWQLYEREFDGTAKGSGDAFVELFAQEFARAYRAANSASRPPS